MLEADRAKDFARLFSTYEDRLRALAISLVRNRGEAEDVLQQASLILWAKFDRYQPGTNFVAWAGRVVYLEVLEHRRRRRHDKLEFGDAFVEAVAHEANHDATWVALGERELAMETCIEQLQPDHREILRKRYVDDCDVTQLSVMFNRSVEAVYLVLSRVRRAVQACVDRKVSDSKVDDHG